MYLDNVFQFTSVLSATTYGVNDNNQRALQSILKNYLINFVPTNVFR